MKLGTAFAICLLASTRAHADEAAQCRAKDGTYLTGSVTSAPRFERGHLLDGVELSHTHLTLLSDQDRRSYDVAIDNVFAAGYDASGDNAAGKIVPAPLSTIRSGDRLELCGKRYTSGALGIDWVHTNCGATPTPAKPDGWLKLLAADGTPGPNLEASTEYCRLWR